MQTKRPKSVLKSRVKSIGVAVAATLLFTTASNAATLYGVTGDGASTPETLYSLSQSDASSTFVLGLGAGDDGETIGFNPIDGLMYHSSGISDSNRFWESINLNTPAIVSSGQFTGVNVADENLAMVYDTDTDRFLVADRFENFFSVTTAGVATTLGTTPDTIKGLAFVGGTLYGGQRDTDFLYTLNPLTGASLLTIAVTLGGASIGAIVKSCVWVCHAAARSWRSPFTNLTPRMISAN